MRAASWTRPGRTADGALKAGALRIGRDNYEP